MGVYWSPTTVKAANDYPLTRPTKAPLPCPSKGLSKKASQAISVRITLFSVELTLSACSEFILKNKGVAMATKN